MSSADFDFGDTDIGQTFVVSAGIDLATANTGTFTFDSLEVATFGGTGLRTGAHTVNISGSADINASFAPALDASGTDFSTGATFGSASSSNSGSSGIRLRDVVGPLSLGGSITGALGAAVDIDGGDSSITFGGTVSNSSGRSVSVTYRTGGTISLTGPITDTGAGIRLIGNDPTAATNFSGGLTLDTGADTALAATNGGTLSITGDNRIGDTSPLTATALQISDSPIGAAGLTFRSISTSGSPSGIVLERTGSSRGFTITGDGSTDGSGGIIEGTADDAVRLDDVGGGVMLRNLAIEDIGSMAGGSNTQSGDDAIDATDVVGLTLDNVDIGRISDNALRGTRVSDLVAQHGSFTDANRFHVNGIQDTVDEAAIRLRDLGLTNLTTNRIDNNSFSGAAEHVDLVNSTVDLDLTITRNGIGTTWKPGTATSTGTPEGKIGIDILTESSVDADVLVGDESLTSQANTFTDNAVASLRIGHFDENATGTIDAVVARNTFTVSSRDPNNPADDPQGGLLLRPFGNSAARFNAIVSDNTFTETAGADGRLGTIALMFDGTNSVAGGVSQVDVSGNVLNRPVNRPFEAVSDNATSATARFDGNTVNAGTITFGGGFGTLAVPFSESFFQARDGGSLDLVFDNHVLPAPTFSSAPAFDSRVDDPGSSLCAALSGNSSADGYRLTQTAGMYTLEQGSSPVTTPGAAVLAGNGNTGLPVNTSGTVTVTGPQNAEVCDRPSGGIFGP